MTRVKAPVLALLAVLFLGLSAALVWAAYLDNTLVPVVADHDLGKRPATTAVSHDFVLKNQSLSSVRIRSLTPSCACDTEAAAARMDVLPLGETTIAVRWGLPSKPGPATTTVVVGFEIDGVAQTTSLTLKCDVAEASSSLPGR